MFDAMNGIAEAVSALLFAGYGLHTLLSDRMVSEFERFGLSRFRVITGVLQVTGSLGMILGHFHRPLLLISAGGLAAMMLLGIITRVRIKDPLYAALPAFALGVLNLFIFLSAL